MSQLEFSSGLEGVVLIPSLFSESTITCVSSAHSAPRSVHLPLVSAARISARLVILFEPGTVMVQFGGFASGLISSMSGRGFTSLASRLLAVSFRESARSPCSRVAGRDCSNSYELGAAPVPPHRHRNVRPPYRVVPAEMQVRE